MAQIIMCDAHEMAHPADWLVTNMDNGDSQAYCNVGYRELMVGTVDAMNAAEADQADADALARLEATQAPDTDAEQPATVETIERDLADGLIAQGLDPDTSRRFAHDTTEAQLASADAAKPARIVGKGQSRKAREHRAKVAAKAERQAPVATLDGARGPDDDEDDDEDAATAAGGPDTETPQA